MKKNNLTGLPFFNPDCGSIVIVRSDDENILVRLAIQLALESGEDLMSTTIAESWRNMASNLRVLLYEEFEKETKNCDLITVSSDSPVTMPLKLLGRAAREKINQRFVGIVGLGHDFNESDWKRLRTEVNMCGQKIAITFFCCGVKGAEIDRDLEFIMDYMLEAQEIDGEIVLTPEEYGGEPFPNAPIRMTINMSDKWYPYQVK